VDGGIVAPAAALVAVPARSSSCAARLLLTTTATPAAIAAATTSAMTTTTMRLLAVLRRRVELATLTLARLRVVERCGASTATTCRACSCSSRSFLSIVSSPTPCSSMTWCDA